MDTISRYTLEAVSDDYEELQMIFSDVSGRLDSAQASSVRPEDIVRTLERLASQGYVQAYRLSSTPPYSVRVPFDATRVSDISFLITTKGLEALRQASGGSPGQALE
jgi:hypothetical protein